VAALLSWELALAVLVYVTVTTAYSMWGKHEPVLDLCCVAAGFVIRAIAGAVAIDVPITRWFYMVASFGSLLVVTGKRSGEQFRLTSEGGSGRRVLDHYTPTFLAQVRSMAAAALILAYCLMAFEKADELGGTFPWFELSIAPFVFGVLRYAMLLDAGRGEDPEDIVFEDRTIQLIGLVWGALFAVGTYR
jgi:decaprenyl-phosphate phosphoribosyltransferase